MPITGIEAQNHGRENFADSSRLQIVDTDDKLCQQRIVRCDTIFVCIAACREQTSTRTSKVAHAIPESLPVTPISQNKNHHGQIEIKIKIEILSQMQMRIEMAFRRLATKWRIFHQKLDKGLLCGCSSSQLRHQQRNARQGD